MKVGDYARTKSGFIDKIININDFREPSVKYALEQPSWNDDVVFVGDEDISKSSPNIIDLIEVGDYVNGAFVTRFKIDENGVQWLYTNNENAYGYKSDEIKSIVTKEQFKSMEYKVGADKE